MGKRGNVAVAAEHSGPQRPNVAGRDVLVVRPGDRLEWGLCIEQRGDTVTVRWPSGSESDHSLGEVQQVG